MGAPSGAHATVKRDSPVVPTFLILGHGSRRYNLIASERGAEPSKLASPGTSPRVPGLFLSQKGASATVGAPFIWLTRLPLPFSPRSMPALARAFTTAAPLASVILGRRSDPGHETKRFAKTPPSLRLGVPRDTLEDDPVSNRSFVSVLLPLGVAKLASACNGGIYCRFARS
jgi:hypothetical protein